MSLVVFLLLCAPAAESNSGSVFSQWKKGVDLAGTVEQGVVRMVMEMDELGHVGVGI